jgi:hypothetical protein
MTEGVHPNDDSWFRLYRRLEHSQVFQNAELLQLWVWCLMRANYKERWGTVALVAGKLRRNAVGIELNADYCEMTMRRIRDTYTGGPLLEAAERQAGLF